MSQSRWLLRSAHVGILARKAAWNATLTSNATLNEYNTSWGAIGVALAPAWDQAQQTYDESTQVREQRHSSTGVVERRSLACVIPRREP